VYEIGNNIINIYLAYFINMIYFISGNIALHIFSRNARSLYDVESLWSVGSEYDTAYNKPDDPLITLLQEHSVYLDGLQPADSVSENTNV
jgi:hypothetical protein